MKILLAEDEKELSRALVTVLNAAGYPTDAVYNGADAVQLASENAYDCMVFDIMMPVMDGITALKQIRQSGNSTPVILLTAKAEVDDRVEGLDSGADDYLTKPFAMKELLARIRSHLRRQETYGSAKLSVGNVTLNTEIQELRASSAVRLAGKETRLMELFLANPGKELSTDVIFDKIWNDDNDKEIVWVYVSYLRNKLRSIGAQLEITGEHGGHFALVEKKQ